jgi:NAD(P)H-nitrite reductase large subunit
MTKQVIIGNGICGVTAALSLLRKNPKSSITLISEEPLNFYARMLLPDYIAGVISEEKLFPFKKEQFASIQLILGKKVEEIRPQENSIVIGGYKRIFYDNLLIASGASPSIPDIEGVEADGIYTLREIREAKKIISHATAGKRAVILGGGLVGLEATSALVNRGLNVELVVSSSQILSRVFDEKSAQIIEDHLIKKGVLVFKNTEVIGIDSVKDEKIVFLDSGAKIFCDLIILAKGVKPKMDFVDRNTLAVDKGIPVNRKMQTNISNIYAAGDVAMAPGFFEKTPIYNATWGAAVYQGIVAANNMAGGNSLYEGNLSANIFEVLGLMASCVGQGGKSNENCETLCSEETGSYKKLVFNEGKLVGALLVGDIVESGVMQNLIRTRVNIQGVEEIYLKNKVNFASLLKLKEIR